MRNEGVVFTYDENTAEGALLHESLKTEDGTLLPHREVSLVFICLCPVCYEFRKAADVRLVRE
jgi:hypothetical protein